MRGPHDVLLPLPTPSVNGALLGNVCLPTTAAATTTGIVATAAAATVCACQGSYVEVGTTGTNSTYLISIIGRLPPPLAAVCLPCLLCVLSLSLLHLLLLSLSPFPIRW